MRATLHQMYDILLNFSSESSLFILFFKASTLVDLNIEYMRYKGIIKYKLQIYFAPNNISN